MGPCFEGRADLGDVWLEILEALAVFDEVGEVEVTLRVALLEIDREVILFHRHEAMLHFQLHS